jgi:hypothetical protein
MFKRTIQLLLVSSLASGAVRAANESFIGEWKLNSSKSKVTDQMKVENAGGNKYAFELGGGSAETIVPDGTDQPGLAGTTLSVTIEGPDSWKIVRKQEGRVLLTAYWKLSQDGNTLTDDYTQFGPDGPSTNMKFVYHRTAGTSGFAGTWESTSETLNSSYVIKVQPYERDGLSFIYSSQGVIKNIKFDGKDYPQLGPNARPGSTTSARRVNEHTLEMTGKSSDKLTDTREIALSPDGRTLTMTIHVADRTAPNILVFERQ